MFTGVEPSKKQMTGTTKAGYLPNYLCVKLALQGETWHGPSVVRGSQFLLSVEKHQAEAESATIRNQGASGQSEEAVLRGKAIDLSGAGEWD